MSNKRIISLLPAATEILNALGAINLLVGRSHECDFPKGLEHVPVCTSSTIHNDMSSDAIDASVRKSIEDAVSLYNVDFDLIKSLNPDIIITQDQCEVCAVSSDDLLRSMHQRLDKELQIISLKPKSLEDVLSDIQMIAGILEIESDALMEELNDRVDIVKHKIKHVKYRPEIFCMEWMKPLMSAGHWTPELIEYAGGIPVISKAFEKSKYIQWEELLAADPDGIIIAPCGFSMERTKEELKVLQENPNWQKLKAVEKGHVFIADGNQYFNRSGPRLVDTLEIIAEILQVNQFYYGYENVSWEQLPKA